MTTNPHLGVHADAPPHYEQNGLAIDAVALAPHIGPCRAIHCIGSARVAAADIAPFLADVLPR